MKIIDLTGQRFGRLFVVAECGRSKDGQKMYRCVCDCGNVKEIRSGNLRSGKTLSCGCLGREKTIARNKANKKHGMRHSRLYGIWMGMRQRCNWEKAINWHLYGGRGIKVCDDWNSSFNHFMEWAIANGYEEDLTLDRIDPDGNYCPENCRWATLGEQNNNKRTCVYVTIDGETKTVTEWCKLTGVNRMTAYNRIRRGWSPIEAVSILDKEEGKRRSASSKFKPTIVDGRFEFESISAAAEYLGVSQKVVSSALHRNGQVKGHKVELLERNHS